MNILIAILVAYTVAGAVQLVLKITYNTEKGRSYLLYADPKRSKTEQELRKAVLLNIVVSISFISTVVYFLHPLLVYETNVPWWRYIAEGATVIFIYDFGYYFMHRYLFHGWQPLMRVHSVHHAAKHPRMIDSLLLHPTETLMGLSLFFASMAIVGGVHVYVFAVLFSAYSVLNLLNHSGINMPYFPLKTLGKLSIIHDKHHHNMRKGNYASITPFPDMIFGTTE